MPTALVTGASSNSSALVIAALARDPAILDGSGNVLVAAQVARELGVSDIDGRQPIPLTKESV